jgi:hypothetical protein
MNNTTFLSFRLGKKSVIGDHSVAFNKRSEYLYKALTDMDCYGLRKNRLYQIFDKYKEFAVKLKDIILERYQNLIKKPALEHFPIYD